MAEHLHPILNGNNLPSIRFKSIEPVIQGGTTTSIKGIKKGITLDERDYYVFDSDGFVVNQEYLNLTQFKFRVPLHFKDPEIIEELDFASNYPREPMPLDGKSCSHRIASFYNDNELGHFIIADEYYIPIEATYDFKDDCKTNHAGLKKNEIHGYFIVLSEIEFLGFQLKYNKNTRLGTKVCPGIRCSSGIFKYEFKDLKI